MNWFDAITYEKDFKFSIDKKGKTASILTCYSDNQKIIIPCSINYLAKKYIITTVSSKSFQQSKIRSVAFVPNSELRTIEKEAFAYTDLVKIIIPSSVVELKDGWCCETANLQIAKVEKGNIRYLSVKNKCIIGKSDIESENYDTLIFWSREAVKADIPETIKIIGPYSFNRSKLTSITIPSHVTKICEYAFDGCTQLTRVEFEPNSELQTIDKFAFAGTKLAIITIPAHVTQI